MVKMVWRLESEREALHRIVKLINSKGDRKTVSVKVTIDGQSIVVVFPESGIDKLEMALRGLLGRVENDLKNM